MSAVFQPVSLPLRTPLGTLSERVNKTILKMVQSSTDIFNENKIITFKRWW